MTPEKILQSLVTQFKTITIEPVIAITVIGWAIVSGAQITTNLLMWKICHIQLNFTSEVCSNLSEAENDEIQKEVQKYVNNFQMNSQWISSVPIVLFSLIAGALSDKFGRKPLIIFPLIGYLVGSILSIINYAFIDTLPLEFFYMMDNIDSFFGGYAVYYLGVYSYGTSVTNPKERAHRLARLDGVETLASVVGTLISPYVFKSLGYFGSYSISGLLLALGIAYLIFLVKEPIQRETNEEEEKPIENKEREAERKSTFNNLLYALGKLRDFFIEAVKIPILGMKAVLMKDRKTIIRILITLQFFCFGLYWFGLQIYNVMYLYMLVVFDGFTETDYAMFNVVTNLASAFCLIILMPFLSGKLQIHDALLMAIILSCETVSSIVSPFALSLWQFYLAQILGCIGYCKYAIVRSLLSKCIDSNEVGRVFSFLAVVASLTPIAGNPIFRQLYNRTLNSFEGAVFLLLGGIMAVTAVVNFFIWTKRGEMNDGDDEDDLEKEKREDAAMENSVQTEISQI